ncbi:hypothetical protein ACFFIX_06080 [Metabacillus herbersteinensis]|uniref:Uncharacterized protein n=1 Tax=Metabacillus herbersteinensis TaxID=283816 RepID=A0ABV6GBG6_9BACI
MYEWLSVIGLFLYFPEDKTEYIPAGITMLIFALGAFFAFKFIVKLSKKEQEESDKLAQRINSEKVNKE